MLFFLHNIFTKTILNWDGIFRYLGAGLLIEISADRNKYVHTIGSGEDCGSTKVCLPSLE